MLCCRPMLSLALAAMLGVTAARFYSTATAILLPYGWLCFFALIVWFVRTPGPTPTPEPLPDGYARHIQPRPGSIARRGLNRFILILCLPCALIAAARQLAWSETVSPGRLPEARYFHATFLALAPNRDYPEQDGRWRLPAVLLTVDGKPCPAVRVRLSGWDGVAFRRGDIVQGRVGRSRLYPKSFPGAFDFRLWLERDGLAGALYLVKPRGGGDVLFTVTPVDDPPPLIRLRRLVDGVRAQAIAATLRHGGDSGGMLAAMLYGYRRDVGDAVRGSFRRVGIGHVLAISGLHVGLIVALLWWASGWFGWGQRWRAVACLVLVVFYLGLSGGQVAASRASLMAAIHLAGIARGRRGDMVNSLGAAALVLVLLNPSAPLDVSFQLSFTAVVFIYMAVGGRSDDRPRLESGPPTRRSRFVLAVNGLTRLSVATWVGLFPIIAAVFNQVNLVGLPINIVVIPLMSLVLAGGLLLPWLAWLPGAAWVATLPARVLTWTAVLADSLPYSSLPAHAPGSGWMLAFYVFIFFSLLRGMLRRSPWRRWWDGLTALGLAVAAAGLVASMGSTSPPTAGRLAHLPGTDLGVVAVQAADGTAALVGAVSRTGMTEAKWLHHVRHGGTVGVAAVGQREAADVAELAWHFPVAGFTGIDTLGAESAAWHPVPGAPTVEYAVGRDARGRAVWLAVRTDGKTLCVAPRIAERDVVDRVTRRFPGVGADVMLVGFLEKQPVLDFAAPLATRVGVIGKAQFPLPDGWFRRGRYRTIRLDETVSGYVDGEWRTIP